MAGDDVSIWWQVVIPCQHFYRYFTPFGDNFQRVVIISNVDIGTAAVGCRHKYGLVLNDVPRRVQIINFADKVGVHSVLNAKALQRVARPYLSAKAQCGIWRYICFGGNGRVCGRWCVGRCGW